MVSVWCQFCHSCPIPYLFGQDSSITGFTVLLGLQGGLLALIPTLSGLTIDQGGFRHLKTSLIGYLRSVAIIGSLLRVSVCLKPGKTSRNTAKTTAGTLKPLPNPVTSLSVPYPVSQCQ